MVAESCRRTRIEGTPPRKAHRARALTVALVEGAGRELGIERPLEAALALSDGRRLFALRRSSDGDSPSLYYSVHPRALRTRHGGEELLPKNGVLVLSEPLDEVSEHWTEVPESSRLVAEAGEVRVEPFAL